MSNIPSFKVGSKPSISKEEYNTIVQNAGSNFLNEPGTYDLMIKTVKWGKTSEKDTAWTSLEITFADTENKEIRHWQLIPTECVNDFLFGKDKQIFAYENLSKFVRAFGISLNFESTMEQVAALFSDLDKLVGKTIRAKIVREGDYMKYLGKDEAGNKQYQIFTKSNEPKVDTIFPDSDSVKNYAKENKINLAFCKIAEFFAAKEPLIEIETAETSAATDELFPF